MALAGNPNVGKSSLFNRLTGLNQHTGNWTGKTVETAIGSCEREGLTFIDLPGTYSLRARSAEEEAASDFIKNGSADIIVAVCDACNLERGLTLVLQILELTPRVIVCVNMFDEAKRRGIALNLSALSDILGVPVVATSADNGTGLKKLCEVIRSNAAKHVQSHESPMRYPPEFESELKRLSKYGFSRGDVTNAVLESLPDQYCATILSRPIIVAEAIANEVVCGNVGYSNNDRRLDKIITHRFWSVPLMLLMLAGIFWLTIVGSNYPSTVLESLFSYTEAWLYELCDFLPNFIRDPLILGVLHTLFSVISVMLPPMAIFFPLFTLAEDFGLLGRIAFNLDGAFKRSGACGKQALTMCMSLGCTAVGAIGCRIIDSPRERKLAALTASFMPCNGKFPMLIAISALLVGKRLSPVVLTAFIMLSVIATLAVSKLLSMTVLKGEASSFALELPPYRRPQFLRVIVHSLIERTLHVLSRAVLASAPAGLIIWVLSNTFYHDAPLLAHLLVILEPLGRLIGLDGVILCAFLLGFPANELVLPLILSGYSMLGISADWSALTCVNLLIFTLFHFPCATTIMTIKRESGLKIALGSIAIPTVLGIILCLLSRVLFSFM